MSKQESRLHHFVPKLLIRPWVVETQPGQFNLRGYWWNHRKSMLQVKQRGLDSFCAQLDLLTLTAHKMGRDAIERIFFGDIDAKGSIVLDAILATGTSRLTADQRSDFARLLLSLDARRPVNVRKIRDFSHRFALGLDTDPEVIAAAQVAGLDQKPSSFYERHFGALEDHALMMIQKLVDNPQVGGRLINNGWHVTRFNADSETLVLSDRPLIRLRGYDHPGGAWILPLTPHSVFFAINHPANLQRIRTASPKQLIRYINVASAQQAERFVFSIDTTHERWLPKYLRLQIKPVGWISNA
jgi:hypothetical protein